MQRSGQPAGRGMRAENVYTIFQQKIKCLMLFFVRALLMRLLSVCVCTRAVYVRVCVFVALLSERASERLILHMLKPSS